MGSNVTEVPTEDFLLAVADAVNGQLLSSSISDIAPRDLKQLFVLPPLCSVSERQLGPDSENNKKITFLDLSDLEKSNAPVIFVGEKEAGKTTLLSYICTQAQPILGGSASTIGMYVNLHLYARTTRANILEAMVAFCGGAYARSQIITLLKAGKVTVCFDNLDLNTPTTVGVVQEFVKEFSSNKFYISVREDVRVAITEKSLPKFAHEQSYVYIHSFGRKQTRELMQRWFRKTDVASQEVDSLLSSLKRLNIPRTPFLISVFLWVHEKSIAFDPVNHVEVIDTLIDGILDKFHETKSRTKLDSTAKRHFLTELSYHLYKLQKDRLTHNDLDLFTAQYFKSRLLTAASGPFIDELTRKGIFLDLGEEICFKFDCFRAFFLSVYFQHSVDFLKEALTKDKFISLGGELDYFTGKQRGREDVLRRTMNVLDEFYAPVQLGLDLKLFEKITASDLPVSRESRDELGRELFPERPDDERREKLLDEMDARSNRHPDISIRMTGPIPEFVRALQIASAILRNTELISNADLKRAAYQKIVSYWSEILLMLVLSTDVIQENPEFRKIFEAIPIAGGDFSYILKLIVPNIAFSLVLECVGTAQLEVVIKDHAANAENCVERLISSMLQMDLSLPQYAQSIARFVEQFHRQKFAMSVVAIKLVERFMLKSMQSTEIEQLRKLLSDVYPLITTTSNSKMMNARRAAFLENVTKTRAANLSRPKN